MAAEQIEIASLSIDFDDVIKESVKLKKEIDKVTASRKELDKTTDEGRSADVKAEAQLKNLKKAYRDNQTFASALDEANKDLTKTMSSQNKGTQELRDSRRRLNIISKSIKGNTEEEIELRGQLNDAIDEQTEALREQSSEFNSSKDSIGEYEDGIKAAFENMNILNGGIGGFIQRSQQAGGTGKLFTSSLKAMATGMWGMVKASIAFIATPVGAILAVLVGAFALIKNAMNRSESATNKIRKAMSGFTGIIKGLLKFLEPLGEFLINGIVKGFELVEKAIFKAMEGIAFALDFLGFDKVANSLRNFTNEIKESAKASRDLVKAEIELERIQRKATKTQLDFQKAAEKLRQIRDNDLLSFPIRIKANKDLSELIKEQLKEERKIADQRLKVANLRIIADGKTKDTLDEQAEALAVIAEIEERLTSQLSEQLTNRNSLRKEALEKARQIMKAELDLFIQGQGFRVKSLEEQLKIAEKAAEKSIEIFREELKAKVITRQEFDLKILEITNSLLLKQAELAADYARRDLQDYIKNNESKLDSDKFLTEQVVNEEIRRLELISEQRKIFAKKRFDEGVLSESDFNDAINAINEEDRLNLKALNEEREEAKKEKEAIDLENKFIAMQEESDNIFAMQGADIERARQAELAGAEKTGADRNLINKKYDAFEKTLNKDLAEFKNEQNSIVLSGLKGLFGESSALGRAFAIAEITTNTIQNASKAFAQAAVFASNPLTAGLAVNANIQGGIIVASGTASAAKAAGVNLAHGGRVSGAGTSTSDSIPANLSNGETVINAESSRLYTPLLSAVNQAGGGVPISGIAGQSSPSRGLIDYDILAAKITEGVSSLPAPIVGVEEFNEVANNLKVIETSSDFN